MRDLTATFNTYRRKAQTKAPKKSEQDFLRERFRPLNKKFGSKPKKEKVHDSIEDSGDDEDTNRRSNHLLSIVSDDSQPVEMGMVDLKNAKHQTRSDGYSSNFPHMATKASDEELSSARANG